MGVFSNKNQERSKKVKEAFASLKEAGVPAFFPRGERQAEIIVYSYCRICDFLKQEANAPLYAKMLVCYIDIMSAIGQSVCTVPDDGSQQTFHKQLELTIMSKYPLFIKDEPTAANIIAYTAANMHNPLYRFESAADRLFVKYNEWIKSVDLLNALNALSSHDGDTEEGYYFENVEELAVYGQIISHGGSVLWLKGDKYINLYQKGYMLYEQGEFIDAISAFNDSLKYNPVGIQARFEMAECYIRLKKYKSATNTLYTMTRFLIKPEDQARFYRRIGYINSEKKKYLCAAACYMYSMWFNPHPSVERELAYIALKSKINTDPLKTNPLLVLKNFEVPILSVKTSDRENISLDN